MPLMTGQFHARRRYWSLAILLAGAIILPWHLWQLWIHGGSFLHDYLVVNLFGRMTDVLGENKHGPLFYLGILRDGFPVVGSGYLWPAAYSGAHGLHGEGSTGRKFSCSPGLQFLSWLFSLAQTKLPWYVVIIYPGIALLISGALSELLGGPRALAACALALALFYFRLPTIADGSPDVKQFAKSVTQVVSTHEPIYVYRRHEPERNGSIVQHNYRGAQNLRPL